jgi:hypothetical protein
LKGDVPLHFSDVPISLGKVSEFLIAIHVPGPRGH